MDNKLYRIETFSTIENPTFNGAAMLYCDGGVAFVKLHPVKLKAVPKNEVTHGEWILRKEKDAFGYTCKFECNKCSHINKHRDNYCHNCGADMRGW